MNDNYYQEISRTMRAWNHSHSEFKDDFWQQSLDHFQDQLPAPAAEKLSHVKMTHSEMQILSFVNDAPHRTMAYQDLVSQVTFSQGMLSRYVKKLTAAELLTRFHQGDNKKAVYVSVTDLGTLIAKLHREMHKTEQSLYTDALAQFDDSQLQTAVDVLSAMSKISLK